MTLKEFLYFMVGFQIEKGEMDQETLQKFSDSIQDFIKQFPSSAQYEIPKETILEKDVGEERKAAILYQSKMGHRYDGPKV